MRYGIDYINLTLMPIHKYKRNKTPFEPFKRSVNQLNNILDWWYCLHVRRRSFGVAQYIHCFIPKTTNGGWTEVLKYLYIYFIVKSFSSIQKHLQNTNTNYLTIRYLRTWAYSIVMSKKKSAFFSQLSMVTVITSELMVVSLECKNQFIYVSKLQYLFQKSWMSTVFVEIFSMLWR